MSEDPRRPGRGWQRARPGRHLARHARERQRRLRRRRGLLLAAVSVVLLAALGVAGYGISQLGGPAEVPDYSGSGESDVIVEVSDGQTVSEIAQTLAQRDVVASARAFVLAGRDGAEIRSIQPGYYEMRTRMSGRAAASLILESDTRVGQFEVRAGLQLADVTQPDGSTVPGILSRISEASCVRLDRTSTCVRVNELLRAMAATSAQELGVPPWARAGVRDAQPSRRLEGLILPGTYNVRPGASPAELLQQAMAQSSELLTAVGMPELAESTPYDPYQVLIIASIIQREAIADDFARVSRVIDNRLGIDMPLQMDSTINYPQQVQSLTTTDAARAAPGPYNTYLEPGLTPTPIGAPSGDALTAASDPADGDWRFFVKCRTDGTSCFAATAQEHQENIELARERDIF